MKRRIYLVLAVCLALVAALLTLRAQHTVPVVVATHNLRSGIAVTADDLRVVRMHDDSVPPGALATIDAALGRYVAWPMTAGEPVVAASLSSSRDPGADLAGMNIPSGYSAVALPVQPAAAVGGVLAPGDHVDIYAVPAHSDTAVITTTDAGGNSALASGAAVKLGANILVVELRSDQGQALGTTTTDSGSTVHGLNFGSGKLGSVVVAVPTSDVPAYAAAVATDSFYLSMNAG